MLQNVKKAWPLWRKVCHDGREALTYFILGKNKYYQ